jgi:Clr5-like protein
MSRSNARNQKISDDEWDMRKEYIRHLYLVDNLPLNRVLDELAQTGFIVRCAMIREYNQVS